MAQIACQRTDIVGNGHFIVVEDDQEIVQLSDIVHSLVDHAAGECTVADDGHHMARLPFQLLAHAMPMATERAVLPCPAIKASWALSLGFGKPERPSSFRKVPKR